MEVVIAGVPPLLILIPRATLLISFGLTSFRCGYEFCYTCGAEWKSKAATCSCLLWDEDNIIYHTDDDELDDEDEDEDDDYDGVYAFDSEVW